MRRKVASGAIAGVATVSSTVVGMMWQHIDQSVGMWILIGCALIFIFAMVVMFWPGSDGENRAGVAVTTHGPKSPGFGMVHGDVHNYFGPPNPAVTQEVKSPYGSGGIAALRPGLATFLPEPEPDMNLNELLVRVYKALGPPPPPGPERKEFWRKIDLAIADKVVVKKLHVWGRTGDRALSPLHPQVLHHGKFDHRSATWTAISDWGTSDLNDLYFWRAEIDKIWPKDSDETATAEPNPGDQTQDFPAPYRKAVLQLQKPVVTKMASGGRASEITSVECALMIEGKAAIKEGRIWLGELRAPSGPVALNTYVRIGRRGDNTFPIHRTGSTARVIIVRRDMTDVVSKPPFLLYTERGDFPLNENTQYHLDLELRSEAEHPTKVALLIHTGSGHELDAAIESQSV
jgi:hypothetical protein